MLGRAKILVCVPMALLCWSGLGAQTTLITSTSVFSGTATVLDFNAILPNQTAITNQYSGQGITFSSGLISLTSGSSGDAALFPSSGGGVIASNWNYSLGALTAPGNATWTATFAGNETRVGFLLEVNSGDTTQITTLLNGVSTGSVSVTSSGLTPIFFGAQNLSGFNSILVTVTGSSNHFLAIDDFRFESVPEPGVGLLMTAGLLMLGARMGPKRARRTRPGSASQTVS